MGDVNYAPLIDEMVWSYSRVRAFEDCPYRWYLKYIRHLRSKDMFFSSYGTFMHKLIELYCREERTAPQLVDTYLREFKTQVVGRAPNQKVFANYFTSGLQYLKHIKPFPYGMIGVEKKVEFEVGGLPFIGYIDFLGEKDGKLYVVDNKSRVLKARSTRAKATKADAELDAYLRQLYIYSAAVENEYGIRPDSLCFNCFREERFIVEPFRQEAYMEATEWLKDSVATIRQETDFNPSIEFFKCAYLCEMQDTCEYYELSKKR